MSVTHLNCLNGAWVPSAGGETNEQRNPADLAQVTARFQKSTLADTRAAVAAAAALEVVGAGQKAQALVALVMMVGVIQLLAGLFRLTGQAPPDPLAAARPFTARLQAAGFGVQVLPHVLEHSTVMVIVAQKG